MVNVGTGTDVTVSEIAELVASLTGFTGATEWDTSRPDGTPQKLLDVSRIHELGWTASIPLREGLADTIAWFRANRAEVRD